MNGKGGRSKLKTSLRVINAVFKIAVWELSDLHFRRWDANENTGGQCSKVFNSLHIIGRILHKSEIVFCFYYSFSSFLPSFALPEKRTVCAISPLHQLFGWIRQGAHYLVSAWVQLYRVHLEWCPVFQIVLLSSYIVDFLFDEQMLSSKRPLCAKDTHLPPPYSFNWLFSGLEN